MNNSSNFQLENLAETIEQMKQQSCDFPVDGRCTVEDFEKIDVDVLYPRIRKF